MRIIIIIIIIKVEKNVARVFFTRSLMMIIIIICDNGSSTQWAHRKGLLSAQWRPSIDTVRIVKKHDLPIIMRNLLLLSFFMVCRRRNTRLRQTTHVRVVFMINNNRQWSSLFECSVVTPSQGGACASYRGSYIIKILQGTRIRPRIMQIAIAYIVHRSIISCPKVIFTTLDTL